MLWNGLPDGGVREALGAVSVLVAQAFKRMVWRYWRQLQHARCSGDRGDDGGELYGEVSGQGFHGAKGAREARRVAEVVNVKGLAWRRKVAAETKRGRRWAWLVQEGDETTGV